MHQFRLGFVACSLQNRVGPKAPLHPSPARFHTERGPNFESALMQDLCKCYGITKSRTTPYHPSGNSSVNILQSLRAERQHRWPEYLPELLPVYNNTIHGSTGYAPSFLVFGRHLRQPVDVGLGVGQLQYQHDMGG